MGQPAARLGDMHNCPKFGPPPPLPHIGGPVQSSQNSVLIGGLPAARQNDKAKCIPQTDTVQKSSFTVLTEKKGAARVGDKCEHGGAISRGCFTVLIG